MNPWRWIRWVFAKNPPFAPAPPPAHAAAAANYVRPVVDGSSVYAHQRRLTEDEVAELKVYQPFVEPENIILTAVGLIGAVLARATLVVSLCLGAVGIVHGLVVVLVCLRRRRMARDIAGGVVTIIRIRNAAGELGVAHEYLPHSRTLWTLAGQPSEWRGFREKF